MLHNPTVRKILGVILSIALSILFYFEIKIGFEMLGDRITKETQQFTQMSHDVGTARVSIDEIFYYPETVYPVYYGDVIPIYNSKLRLQINGVITDMDAASSGVYRYSQDETEKATTLYIEDKSRMYDEYMDAYREYLDGNQDALMLAYGIQFDSDMIIPYEQSYKEFRVPIMFNEKSAMYYGFIPEGTSQFWVITCEDPFVLSLDKISAHFGDPVKNPMKNHTYSDYEVLAAENTLRSILESILQEEDGAIVSSPYQSGGVVGTADTYTSTSDNNIRKQMVSYADYKWDYSGQAAGTNLTIDTTSTKAIASEWVLTATTYSYQNAGLQLLNLHGSKSSTSMEISGNIMNTLSTERPYVIVVKYIDSARNLLGIDVLDNRQNSLMGNSYHTFTSTKYSTDFNLDEVNAVQFEIY